MGEGGEDVNKILQTAPLTGQMQVLGSALQESVWSEVVRVLSSQF